MGLFGKLKENLGHGGIKVQLQAPASVSMSDASFPVTVTLTASDQQQTIENVKVEITARSYDQSFSTSNNNPPTTQSQEHMVAEANYAQAFTIMPGETKSVPLTIIMNQGAAAAAQLPEGSGMAQVAGAFQKLQSLSETMNSTSYQYTIEASAKIQGITLGPAYNQPIQILKPGELGGATQGNLGIHL